MLNMNAEKSETQLTLYLEGRLDTTTAPDLEREINAQPDTVQAIILDFGNLRYLSSAGLRIILSTYKMMAGRKGRLIIRNVNPLIMEVFDATGFTDVLTIEKGGEE